MWDSEEIRRCAGLPGYGLSHTPAASVLSRAAFFLQIPPTGYDAVRIALGLFLLTAAGLKGYELAAVPVAESGFITVRWYLIGIVEFELFFGLWLLLGAYRQRTWFAAIVFFGVLAVISLRKGLSGEASCGCFGELAVSPWFTLALDFFAVGSLLIWQPECSDPPKKPSCSNGHSLFQPERFAVNGGVQVAITLVLFVLIGVPSAIAMSGYTASTMTENGVILGDGNDILLEPDKWIGKRFPLVKYIDIGKRLVEGKWIVVFHHRDCPRCQELIPKYGELARNLTTQQDASRIALIELPPFGDRVGIDASSCLAGRMISTHNWFLATPSVIQLRDGIVLSAGQATRTSVIPATTSESYGSRSSDL